MRACGAISEFGRRSGLSHKALRLYDLSGLLPPAHVDPASGYRFYAVDQLERARRIGLLRRLEMPLATVAEVLAGGDEEAAARLERWWTQQEAGLVTPDSEAPVEVCVPFTGAVEPAGPIVIRIEPAHTEAYCTLTRDECGYPQILVAYDAVEGWVRRAGTPVLGAPREVYFAAYEQISGGDPFVHVAQPVERTAR